MVSALLLLSAQVGAWPFVGHKRRTKNGECTELWTRRLTWIDVAAVTVSLHQMSASNVEGGRVQGSSVQHRSCTCVGLIKVFNSLYALKIASQLNCLFIIPKVAVKFMYFLSYYSSGEEGVILT